MTTSTNAFCKAKAPAVLLVAEEPALTLGGDVVEVVEEPEDVESFPLGIPVVADEAPA